MPGPTQAARRLMPGPVVVLLVLVIAASGCGSKANKNGEVYVALGDSYTAGPGIPPVADPRCGRSRANYPSLVAKALKVAEFNDRSCSGASTLNLATPQMVKPAKALTTVRLNDPQLEGVDRKTTLVTIGMGLNNDAISTGLLVTCYSPAGSEPSNACMQYLSLPESTINAQIQSAAVDVQTAIESIKTKAPDARIILVGYPRMVPDNGSCPDLLPFPDAQIQRLREAMKFTNQAWKDAAQQADALYVDMYTPSEGHDICSEDPWVNGITTVPGQAEALHPFEAYQKAVSAAIVKLVEED